MPSNRSMAVWCATRQSGTGVSGMEAHINYWHIAGDEEFRRKATEPVSNFVEIGVMLDDPTAVEHICIYLSTVIDAVNVRDCCPYFTDTKVAQGVFNEVLSATRSGQGPAYVELRHSGALFCRIHQFLEAESRIDASELEVVRFADGTLLKITRRAVEETCVGLPPQSRAYFRLRILLGKANDNAFIRTIPTIDRLLQSGFDEVQYVDFRLNEARTLPDPVESRMRNEGANTGVRLKLVAFLTAIPVLSDLSVSSPKFHKLRLLEHHLWNEYVSGGIPDGMTVYHWKHTKEGGIDGFSAFVKLQTRRTGRKTLIRYLLWAFAFGVLGNLVASAIVWAW